MLKLSIIVPIYNVEPYLRKCVDSLLMQDLDSTEYEIILVDDGSPDGCPAICDEYAQTLHPSGGSRKGANIVVIHQPNGGLSAARNSGLKVAQGKYVQFVDSDDYLEPNVLGGLVAQMERENLDVLRFDYQNVHITSDGTYEIFQPYKHPHQVDKRTDVVDGVTYLNERMSYACYAWMFLVKRSLLVDIQQSPIFFTKGILFEDTDWTPRMLLAAKRVHGTTTIAYNYLLREGSITQGGNWNKKKKNVESLFIVNENLRKLMFKYDDKRWLRGCISDNVYDMLNMIITYDYEHIADWLYRLQQTQGFPLFAYKRSFRIRLKYILINISPKIYCKLMHGLH